jgi:hypothetical protein
MVVGLTVFFFLASCVQLIYLHWNIVHAPRLDVRELLSLLESNRALQFDDVLHASKIRAQVMLEANALERRYHQANVLLMSRVWTRYLGFVTGMILALVGVTFILGRLQAPTTNLQARAESAQLSVKSASPGIILAVLGVFLMIATIITHHEIGVTDTAIYTGRWNLAAASEPWSDEQPKLKDRPSPGDSNRISDERPSLGTREE